MERCSKSAAIVKRASCRQMLVHAAQRDPACGHLILAVRPVPALLSEDFVGVHARMVAGIPPVCQKSLRNRWICLLRSRRRTPRRTVARSSEDPLANELRLFALEEEVGDGDAERGLLGVVDRRYLGSARARCQMVFACAIELACCCVRLAVVCRGRNVRLARTACGRPGCARCITSSSRSVHVRPTSAPAMLLVR